MAKENLGIPEQTKSLRSWAEESLFSDQVPSFIQFCSREGVSPDKKVSYKKFHGLMENFGM